jgi:hypothetical protein
MGEIGGEAGQHLAGCRYPGTHDSSSSAMIVQWRSGSPPGWSRPRSHVAGRAGVAWAVRRPGLRDTGDAPEHVARPAAEHAAGRVEPGRLRNQLDGGRTARSGCPGQTSTHGRSPNGDRREGSRHLGVAVISRLVRRRRLSKRVEVRPGVVGGHLGSHLNLSRSVPLVAGSRPIVGVTGVSLASSGDGATAHSRTAALTAAEGDRLAPQVVPPHAGQCSAAALG